MGTRIADEEAEAMKKMGYRLLEFGPFNWEKVMSALRIFKERNGHVDVPRDYVINDDVLYSYEGTGFDESFRGMELGEAVECIRIGDVDGFEDKVYANLLIS